MKRISAGVFLVGALAAVGVYWTSRAQSPDVQGGAAPFEKTFAPVNVTAPDEGGLSLLGIVVDSAGQPVEGATVSLAATAQTHLQTLRCRLCEQTLLECPARESASEVEEWVRHALHRPRMAVTVQTDARGEFLFSNLQGVSFTVWAHAPPAGLGDAVLERAAPGEGLRLVLPRARKVFGRLLGPDGAGISGGTVHVLSTRVSSPLEALTDARGHFQVSGMGEGPWVLLATARGYLPAKASVQPGPGESVLRLSRAKKLSVRTTLKGQPLEAEVRVSHAHLERQGQARKGEVLFEQLYPGTVSVRARSGTRVSASRQVRLEAEETRVDLELLEGGTLEAQVLDEEKKPVPRASLRLFRPDGSELESAEVTGGELRKLGPLLAGEYRLRVVAQGFLSQELPVAVAENETRFVEIVLARALEISGRLLDEYGRPAPKVSVLVSPISQDIFSDEEGRFVAQVPSAGLYTLQAHHSLWGGVQLSVTAPAKDVELTLQRQASAEILVLAEGQPLEGAQAVLFVEGKGTFRSDAPSGVDGRVFMRGMPPGTYFLVATHSAWLPSERQSVNLNDGADTKVVAELRAGERVRGVVLDDAGQKVPGATVVVSPRGIDDALSDQDGRFEVGPVPASATLRLEARHPAFETSEPVAVTVGGGEARLVLKRKSVFSGRVLSGSAEPLRRFVLNGELIETPDGRFEVGIAPESGRVLVMLEAAGCEPLSEERPAQPDLGDFVLRHASRFSGRVIDSAGAPVTEASVWCEGCSESALTALDGTFELPRPTVAPPFMVHARKGGLSTSAEVLTKDVSFVELKLLPRARLEGLVIAADGRPAAGVEVEGVRVDLLQNVSFVTDEQGRFGAEVAPGAYRFHDLPASRSTVSRVVVVSGQGARANFGPVSGTGPLTVRLSPRPGYGLWLVPGSLSQVGNPPSELIRVHESRLWYQPLTTEVTFVGVVPGRYTLVWGSFHNVTPHGPTLHPVSVPSGGPVTVELSPSPVAH